MRIKMLKQQSGSYDGIHVRVYEKDEEFEVGGGFMSADLAKVFVESGVAQEVGPAKKTPPGPSETKEDEKKDEKKK